MEIQAVRELLAAVAPPGTATAAVPVADGEHEAGRSAALEAMSTLGAGGEVGADAHGVPVFPSGLVGSISHSSGVAVAVVGSGFSGLGVDIEGRLGLPAEMHGSVASPTELVAAADMHACGPSEAAVLLFCAKEALYKAHFPLRRQRYEFRDIELVVDGFGWRGRGDVLGGDVLRVSVRPSAAAGFVAAVAHW